MKTKFQKTKLCFALSSILIASSLQPMAFAYTSPVGAGQISSGETIDGPQIIEQGGKAENSIVTGFGQQNVTGQGSSSNHGTLEDGGQQTIANGAVADGMLVLGNGQSAIYHGTQTIKQGGLATNTRLENVGQQFIEAGGRADNAKLYDLSRQTIKKDGVANDTLLNNSHQDVYGVANKTVVQNDGRQLIDDGGVANDSQITSLGWQTIKKGGTANGTHLSNVAGQNVSGGVANGTIIGDNSWQDVRADGTANNTTIEKSGWQNVFEGGVAKENIVEGAQNVNGGTANNNTIKDGGKQVITNNGQANITTVEKGGEQHVINGIATDNKIEAGGIQNVDAQGIVNNNVISGTQNIKGGSANTNDIYRDGIQNITDQGHAKNTTVHDGGTQNVLNGTTDQNHIKFEGTQNIGQDGVANDNVISGTQNIIGGTANKNDIYKDGVQTITAGGQATATTVNNGGTQNVNDGKATGNTIAAGGTQNIGNAGHAIESTVFGQQEVAAEGKITDTIVDGGLSYLHEGAQSTGNLTINNGGLLAVNATTVTDRTVDGVSIDSKSQMIVINQTGEDGYLTIGNVNNNGTIIINGFHSLDGESNTTRPFEDFVVVHADTLAGQGSILMHTDIGQQIGDLLSVGQLDAAAQQSLDVQNNAASAVTVNDHLTIVTTDSGGKADQFSLSHAVEQGGYQFGLRQINGDKDWELYALDQDAPPIDPGKPVDPDQPTGPNKPVLSSTADAAANSIVSTYLANFVDTQTLLHRMGELREGQTHVGLWGRAYGGKLDSFGNGLLSGFNMKYYSMQLGADYQVNLEHSRVYFGGAVSYLHGDQDFHKVANYLAKGEVHSVNQDGDGTLKNYNAYLYATYMTDQHFYVDTVLKYGHMRSKFGVKDSAGANVSGHSSINLYGLSAEVGQRFYLDGDQHFYVTPQAQLTYTHFGSGTYKASNGLNVKVKSRDSWLGRVGAEIGYQFKSENPINVYARASYLKEFSNDGDFMLNTSRESYSMKGHWWQYEVGVNAKIGQQHNVYLNVNYNKGQRFNQKQLNIGYRYEF